MTPKIESIDHLVLTVADIEATVGFYCDTLGMTHEHFIAADGTTRHALKFGIQKINLHKAGHEFAPNAKQATKGSADLCFLTTTPLDAWTNHLRAKDIQIEEGPIARTGATGPIMSIYIRDLDGNLIEISVAA